MGCEQSSEDYINTVNACSTKDHRKNNKKNKKINDRLSIGNQVYENVTPINKKVTIPDLSLIDQTICSHFLLYRLSKSQRLQLIECVSAFSAEKGQYIFKQGDPASLFFIISKGKIGIQINGNQTKVMGPGEYFGQLALLYAAPRSASVKALEDCKFWCLSQSSFKKTLHNMVKQNYQTAKSYMSKIAAFDFLTDSQKDAIAYNMHNLRYQQGQNIFKQGDDANSFYVIISGQVEIDISGKKKIILKPGDSFGENSFKEGQFRHGTAKAANQVKCLSIGRQAVKACLGGKFEQLRLHNIIKWALKRSSLFKGAPNNLIDKIIPLVTVQTYTQAGKILIQEGQKIDTFFICLEGQINGQQTGKIIYEDLITQKKVLKAKNPLIVSKRVSLGILNFSAIESVIGGSLSTHLSSQGFAQFNQQDEISLGNLRPSLLYTFKPKLQDYNVVAKLGQGQFGKVYMVQRKDNSNIKYAIKCIEKNMIVKNEMEVFIQQQRAIMVEINFPLIVQLQATFKDEHFIYLLMEFIDGGDFFDILRQIGLLNFYTSRFYLACLLVCIEYLHSKSIVYRDLKPENAVVSEDGYLHMIDLGTAKFLDKESGYRTFTIIGTPHYMAPEIIQGKGYGFSSDIWSLGIIFYEMVCGYLPFGEDMDDPYEIYKQIEKGQVKYPKMYKDVRGKQLIKRLLVRNPQRRAVQKFSLIKKMTFFEGFDWPSLLRKSMKVPYKPKKKNHKQKRYNNYQFLSLIEKEKKLLGKPEVSQEPHWDDIFQVK